MKKIIISFLSLFIIVVVNNAFAGETRTCETLYTEINGIRYFSSIHCTENINLYGVVVDKKLLKDVVQKTSNDFIIKNNNKIIGYVEDKGKCNLINEVAEIKEFENIIYSNNDINYITTTAKIEELTKVIEDLQITFNDPELYNRVCDDVKIQFPIGANSFLKNETKKQYFNKQLEIKNDILDKQKEKLTLLYKLSESKKHIENFYTQISKICDSYYSEKWGDLEIDKENKVEEIVVEIPKKDDEFELINKYKEEFNKKLGKKIDTMSKPVLETLSIKLHYYVEKSPLFKKISDSQKIIIKLKIKALKEVVDDRIIK